MEVTGSGLALHRDALVIDSHNDAIVSHLRRGGASLTGGSPSPAAVEEGIVLRLRGPLEEAAYAWTGQIDFPQMRDGGIDAAFFAVDVTRAWRNHLAYALDAFGFFLTDMEAAGESVTLARTAADITAAKAAGRPAAVLVIENSDALEGSLHVLQAFHVLGVRSITLTHNPSSWAAAGCAEAECGSGLTRFGVALVRQMNRLGMLVDVSHISPRGFADVLRVSERPVIASHSCCAALADHPRNLADDQLRALGQHGGVVGITFVPRFLDAAWRDSDWPLVPGVDRLLEHVDHAVQVAGIDHVGIGSDFDGGGTALRNAADFPRLTEGLLARGYSETDVRKVMGENTLRVLRAALGN